MRFLSFSLLLAGISWTNGQSLRFTTSYAKKKVSGRIENFVTFEWKFSGGVDTVTWGLANEVGAVIDKVFVTLDGRGVDVVPSGSVPVEYKGRVNGTRSGDSSSGQASFTLYDLTKDDERLYGCLLKPNDPNLRQIPDFVQLVVVGPPNITLVSHNQTANEGDKVILNCTADGNPPPNITWTRLASNSHVTFPLAVRRQDEGGYRCTADNGFGIKIRDVFITVQYAATVQTVAPITSHSWIGQTVKLTCKADGSPTPTLSWKSPSGRVIRQEKELKTTVDVLMKSDQDFGNYTCEATNNVNTDTSTVLVQQIKAPGSPTATVKIEATSITVRWTKPADDGGSPITAYRVLILRGNTEIGNKNITDMSVKHQDIGSLNKSTNYTVKLFARNYVFEGNATEMKIQTKYEGRPAAAEITDLPATTKAVAITLKWKEAENNGAPITQYTVYRRTVLENGTSLNWINITEITDMTDRKVVVNLEKGKEYEFVVSATNSFGEGGKEEGKIRKIKVLGGVPSPVAFTYELNPNEITLKWEEPNNNGAEITVYTVYYGTQSDEEWKETENITDVSLRKYVVKVEMGQKYEVLVTASNKYGESSKEGKILRVDVPEGSKPGSRPSAQMNTAVVAGAAAVGVLVIVGVIIFAIWWKRRKSSSDDASPSASALRGDNPYELDDGYQDVSASVAAQGLQAEAGPMAEADYAQVDMSKKKRNRRPETDEYAQVDKSKKSKKPRKQPGELDYAELDDFRPSVQPAAAAEAAPARPLIRRPVYEGTEYADITQFGVPQPEPTYGNIPKKDVVYSNVQGLH
ncbi:cell adhesion molecule DSCAM-like isoform X2 [Porites lutea]|uniref:cell adhesion molecule DSCAM-like isoform X2 n=1 Tax=Porites lutea TaxID=51062 RepID=UPI003CC5D19E